MKPTSNFEYCERRVSSLKKERSGGWEGQWREVSDYIEPFRARFAVSDSNNGRKRSNKIINGRAKRAVNILSAGLMTGLTSPARPWFNLQTPDEKLMEYKPVKDWLEAVETRIYAVMAASNYYQVLHSSYRELALFGVAPMLILPDYDDVIRAKSFAIGEYWIAQDDKGVVDTFYREFEQTAYQMVLQFGKENCSMAVQNAYDSGSYQSRFTVCHLIERNKDKSYFNGLMGATADRPFRSMYWEHGNKEKGKSERFLEVRGMYQCLTCPRWDAVSGDTYGIAPAFEALPDVKQLQALEKRKLDKIAKANNPPMRASVDMKNNRTSTLAGDVTYTSSDRSVYEPLYQIDSNIQALAYEVERKERHIDEYFYVDTFLMIANSDKNMTATEVSERKEEKLIQLGPTLTRLKDEKLDLDIRTIFGYLERAGLVPPRPDELQELGEDFKIEYISLLAQAQKAVSTSSIERTAAFASSMAAENPSARHRFNADKAIQRYANDIGAPASVIRSDEEVAELEAAEAQAAQSQQAMQTMEMAGKTAQSLSQVDLTGQNALSAIAGL